MEEENKTPMMLTFLFGEAAKRAQRGASERLLRWCQAYDEWLAERKRTYRPCTTKQSVIAWRRLVQQSGKTPWELTPADIEQHAAWMQAEGYSPATICNALGIFSNFFWWCSERQVDPECEAGFNPAEKVRRPKVRRYRGAKLLSRGEVEGLVGILKRDKSPLGQRDYAFTLARLRLGAPLNTLQQLRWGQIEQDPAGAWARWHQGRSDAVCRWRYGRRYGQRWKPAGAWRGCGRETIPSRRWSIRSKGMWATGRRTGRRLSTSQILMNLKLYGRLAGIEEDKLTLMALRRTAMRLRLDEGASLEEMQVFLNSHEQAKSTKFRLGRLPELPVDEGGCDKGKEDENCTPVRKPKPFKPGEGVIHGLYARSQPPQAVAAVLAENIQGIGEEIVGLRMLARGLLERQGQARNDQEAVQLGEAYSQAAPRLGEIIKAEKELAESGKASQWADDLLAMLDRGAIENGREPISDEVRKEALGGEPELAAAARRPVEEIALMRHVLRNVFRLAIKAEETQEQIHL